MRLLENVERPTTNSESRTEKKKIVEQKETKKTKFLIFDLPLIRCLLFNLSLCSENLRDFVDRVPIARGGGHAEELLDFAEVADRFHLPTIQTQNKSVFDRNDLQQPLIVRGQTERKRRQRLKSFRQHVHEPRYVRARGLP